MTNEEALIEKLKDFRSRLPYHDTANRYLIGEAIEVLSSPYEGRRLVGESTSKVSIRFEGLHGKGGYVAPLGIRLDTLEGIFDGQSLLVLVFADEPQEGEQVMEDITEEDERAARETIKGVQK